MKNRQYNSIIGDKKKETEMSYLAIYRRFRPSTFDKMVGQEHVVKTLINQIKTDRIGHAYLFCGARGTGKTSAAKIFARAINCLHPVNGSPCGECEACKALADSANLDVLEIDAASNNKVENIREIRDKVQYPPVAVKYKVYIIDEVHMLTTEAFNALLKTLEEPPKHAVFVLATTEPHKLPATILSRCMRFDFRLVPEKTIATLVASIYDELGKQYEQDAVTAIARAGEGSVRDALSVADLCVSCSSEKLTYNDVIGVLGATDSRVTSELCEYIFKGETGKTLEKVGELVNLGKSVGVLARDILKHLRDIMVVKTCADAKEILSVPDGEYKALEQNAALASVHGILRAIEIFSSVENDLKYSVSPRIVLETAAMRASMPEQDYDIDALLSRISKLEKKLEDFALNPPTVSAAYTPTVSPIVSGTAENDSIGQTSFSQRTAETAVKPAAAEKPETAAKYETAGKFETAGRTEIPVKAETKRNFATEEVLVPPPEEEAGVPSFEERRFSFDDEKPFERKQAQPARQSESFAPAQQSFATEVKPAAQNGSGFDSGEKGITQTPPVTLKMQRRTDLSDARIWGMVVRKLRADKNIMLWIACQDLEARTIGGVLNVIADGDNEYNMISKPENLAILKKAVAEIGGLDVVLVRSGEVGNNFDEDLKKAKEVLGNVEETT